jgi:hypothetical protein
VLRITTPATQALVEVGALSGTSRLSLRQVDHAYQTAIGRTDVAAGSSDVMDTSVLAWERCRLQEGGLARHSPALRAELATR